MDGNVDRTMTDDEQWTMMVTNGERQTIIMTNDKWQWMGDEYGDGYGDEWWTMDGDGVE